MRVSRAAFRDALARSRARKARRAEKGLALGLRTPDVAPGRAGRRKAAPSRWKALAAQCDALLSTLTLLRGKHQNGGICVICRERYAQCGYHLVPRGRYATRWDESNVVPGCHPCNWGEKNNRLQYRERHWEIFGGPYMLALESKARQLAKFSVPDLEALKADLKSKMGAA